MAEVIILKQNMELMMQVHRSDMVWITACIVTFVIAMVAAAFRIWRESRRIGTLEEAVKRLETVTDVQGRELRELKDRELTHVS